MVLKLCCYWWTKSCDNGQPRKSGFGMVVHVRLVSVLSFMDCFWRSDKEIRRKFHIGQLPIFYMIPRWWFQIFFMFTPTWGNDPIWPIFFKLVETETNNSKLEILMGLEDFPSFSKIWRLQKGYGLPGEMHKNPRNKISTRPIPEVVLDQIPEVLSAYLTGRCLKRGRVFFRRMKKKNLWRKWRVRWNSFHFWGDDSFQMKAQHLIFVWLDLIYFSQVLCDCWVLLKRKVLLFVLCLQIIQDLL